MTPRLIALALALVLLLTQQLGLQHLLSHGLQSAGLAVASASAHTGSHTSAHTSSHPTDGDPASADPAADGLCQACLALVVLGTATLPALLRWAAVVHRAALPGAPFVRAVRRGAGAPYLARAPPLRA
jgi:cobalamin synthase